MPTLSDDGRDTRTLTHGATSAPEAVALSVCELIGLAAASVVGIVALVSLALAHLHRHTLTGVALVSGVLLVALAALVWRFDRVAVDIDRSGLGVTLVGAALAGVFFFPGFQYGTGDRDPGAYIEIASAIARTHAVDFVDDLRAAGLPGGTGPGAEWPALWDMPGHPGRIFPQFYHLWPALLATAKDAGGFTGMFNTGPLLGLVSVALAIAIGRRIAGLAGAWTAAVILPTNMLEVWQAKYPTAEIFGQMLFLGAVLGLVLAVRVGWRSAAASSGLLLCLGYLERADGILVILLAWATLCLLLAAGRFDSRAAWFAVGLLVPLPYALYQGYGLARHYTLANGVPRLPTVLIVMSVAAAGAAASAAQRHHWSGALARIGRRDVQVRIGSAYIGVCALLVVIGGLRPKIFGMDYMDYLGVRQRSFDEISFIRLTWFFSLPGIALMCAGIAFAGWTRWRFDTWLIAIVSTGLLALYCYHLRNSPYLMWATRRFVTTVVPGMVLLMGCGAMAIGLVAARWRPRLARPAVLVPVVGSLLLGLAAFGASQSLPLRHHDENGGSIEVEERLAALSGEAKGVYLWQHSGACCAAPYQLFGGPMLSIVDQSSALLPSAPNEASAIRLYVQHFQGSRRPIFYVAVGKTSPPPAAGVAATKILELAGTLPHWAETYTSRPSTTRDYHYDMTVYRLDSAPGGGA